MCPILPELTLVNQYIVPEKILTRHRSNRKPLIWSGCSFAQNSAWWHKKQTMK